MPCVAQTHPLLIGYIDYRSEYRSFVLPTTRPDKLDHITEDLCGFTAATQNIRLYSLSDQSSILIDSFELAPVIAYLQAALAASQTSDQ